MAKNSDILNADGKLLFDTFQAEFCLAYEAMTGKICSPFIEYKAMYDMAETINHLSEKARILKEKLVETTAKLDCALEREDERMKTENRFQRHISEPTTHKRKR